MGRLRYETPGLHDVKALAASTLLTTPKVSCEDPGEETAPADLPTDPFTGFDLYCKPRYSRGKQKKKKKKKISSSGRHGGRIVSSLAFDRKGLSPTKHGRHAKANLAKGKESHPKLLA